jgi:methoxymalonate biosynthesis acyl carrier protein
MSDTVVRIREFIGRQTRGRALRDDDDVFASGYVNSMFGMQLVQFVETAFGIVVENEDLELDNFRSVNAVAALVARKTGHPAA